MFYITFCNVLLYNILLCIIVQAHEDESLKTVEVMQTIKKILAQIRQRRQSLTELFSSWTVHVEHSKGFKTEWSSFVEETRQVSPCTVYRLIARINDHDVCVQISCISQTL